jgi:striatin 1/3/4
MLFLANKGLELNVINAFGWFVYVCACEISFIASHVNTKIQNRMSTYGQNMTQVSPTSATPGLDPLGRAKSREFLRMYVSSSWMLAQYQFLSSSLHGPSIDTTCMAHSSDPLFSHHIFSHTERSCLQEISYLTASVPQSIASAMPPAPTRLVRNESDRRAAAAAGGRNRKSDYFPATQTTSGLPPPLNRASSVPLSTLQSFGKGRPTANSPPAPIIDEAEDATLRQFTVPQSAAQPASNRNTKGSEEPTRTETIVKPAPLVTTNMTKPPTEKMDSEKDSSDDTDSVDEEPVTVVHSPLSGDDWHAKLQRAGQQLALQSKPKKASKSEDDVQLVRFIYCPAENA